MSDRLLTINTVDLNNNCPECFSTKGLQLTFKQRFIETAFYKSITQEVNTEMHCTVCNTTIYPARWTDDIERVYDYQMKAFQPKKSSKKYKSLFWILIGAVTILIAAILSVIVYQL
ncbi:MAG: putative nucleic acid-binding Zn ribbon protein [Olleya marilimosa]|jgi:predicted nucleic acid-binding Zn ribbon protein|uniref:Uncharacterized protein n=1 Tax=Olleya marilimosa TaxID=272164 RepID=A0ABR8LYI9_9FLAO|nr:hypothetical protein [Olleya marilimosa]MBD3864189.1 hypothetical protein [Olleya marilimosa]|tara:strand:- start:25782 stop:26129 length:348 start_codon:yes stop_codon:yes gene_type:complete